MDLELSVTDTPTRTRWAPVVVLGLAMFVVTSELTITAVTLPGIGAELGVSPAATAWVVLAYALPMAALGIPAGRWGDRADVRSVLVISQVGIAAASVLSALAPAFGVLVLGRVLQGAAAAFVIAVYMPIVTANVHPAQRGRAISYVITIMTVGGMAGAPLGGLVAASSGWRGVFLMKVPVLLVVIAAAARSVASVDGRGLPRPDRGVAWEALLLGGAITGLLLTVEFVAQAPLVAGAVALGAMGLAVGWTRLPSSGPVLALVRGPAFARTVLALLALSSTVGLLVFLVPFLVADVQGAGAERTGLALLFFVGAVAVASPPAGALADRFGSRRVAAVGAVVTLAGMVAMLTVGTGSGLVDLAWRIALFGLGSGLFNAPINAAVLHAAPPDMTGTAGGVAMTARMIASTSGPAVAALAWTLAGGGIAGYRAGTGVLIGFALLGLIALLSPTRRRTA